MSAPNPTLLDLLRQHSGVSEELRDRGYCRTSNNPVGDVAEHLFSKTFGWALEANSKAGFDARCDRLGKIQIKSRKLSKFNTSRQAGDIRQLNEHKFDWLAGVVFDPDWDVHMAVLLPHAAVESMALGIKHTNSSRIYLRDSLLEKPDAKNVTFEVRQSWLQIRSGVQPK